jgi:hypothetical protein
MTVGTGPAGLMTMIAAAVVSVEPGQGMTHFACAVISPVTILVIIGK